MASADQGTSDQFMGQPFAEGDLGSSQSDYGIYTFFSQTNTGSDLGTTEFYMPAVRGDGYYDGYFVATTLNPYYFSFSDLSSDLISTVRMLSTQLAGGDSGNSSVTRSPPNFFSLTEINSGGAGGGTVVTTYYKVRGYYVVGAVYETYVTTTLPGTNPTGHALIDLVIVSTWRV